jgi:hypothetical protein
MKGPQRPSDNWRVGMTRTKEMASSGPQAGSSRRGLRIRPSRRALLAVPVALCMIAPAGATAAEATNGYTQAPPPPTTTTVTTTTPAKSVSPAKSVGPAKAVSPSVGTPVTIKPSPAPSTLPFTGLDLRWVIGAGILLLGMGLGIRLMQRRAHSS